MGGRTWKPEQVAELRRLVALGLAYEAIAKRLDRTSYAISNRCQVLGIRNREAAIRNSARALRADPVKEAMRRAKIKATWTPERKQKQAEVARRVGAEHPKGSEARRKAGASISETMMGWCPEEYRPAYFRLIRRGFKRAEAKPMILEQMAADESRRLAAMSPFERQAEALKNGARIVEKFVPPSRDYDFTLGGISNLGEAA